MDMDVSNLRVTQTNAYSKSDAVSTKADNAETAEAVSTDADAATFEADGGRSYSSAARTGYTVDTETIERLRSENEQRMANLVREMLGKQLKEAGTADYMEMWDAFRLGDFEATPEEIAQAQKDVADDGYWGVEQTSDRFVQYATALTGGDPDKLDSMIEAFEKGFAEAEKAWGGKLPDLSQRTREATLKKFQDLKDKYAQQSESAPVASASAQSLLASKVQEAADKA